MKYKISKKLVIFRRWANTTTGESILTKVLTALVILWLICAGILLVGYIVG